MEAGRRRTLRVRPRRPQGRGDAAARQRTSDVACAKCHPKSVFNLPFPKPDSCGNAGCHTEPARRPPVRHAPVRVVPLADVQDAQAAELRSHRADASSTSVPRTARSSATTATPRRSARRSRTRACEQCHAKDNHHGERFEEFGDAAEAAGRATRRAARSSRRARSTTASNTQFKLEASTPRSRAASCHRGKGAVGLRGLPRPRRQEGQGRVHGLSRAREGPRRCRPSEGQVQERSVPRVPHATPAIRRSAPASRTSSSRTRTARRHVPARQGPQGRAVRRLPHGRTTSRQDVVRDDLRRTATATGSATRTRCTRARSARCARTATVSRHVGRARASITRSRSPRTPRARSRSSRSRASTSRTSARTATPRTQVRADAGEVLRAEGCHAEDDAHKGRLGDKCEKCHLETGDNIFNHNTMSRVPARRQALDVRCADCHPSITFKPRPTTASAATPSRRSTRASTAPRASSATRRRRSRRQAAARRRRLLADAARTTTSRASAATATTGRSPASGNLCINCHRQDDIHSNSLSPRCGECHTQWSFAPARFDHTQVGCNLTGLHRTLACNDCHRDGNFVGLSADVRELPPRRRGGVARAAAAPITRQHDVRATATTRTRGSTRPARGASGEIGVPMRRRWRSRWCSLSLSPAWAKRQEGRQGRLGRRRASSSTTMTPTTSRRRQAGEEDKADEDRATTTDDDGPTRTRSRRQESKDDAKDEPVEAEPDRPRPRHEEEDERVREGPVLRRQGRHREDRERHAGPGQPGVESFVYYARAAATTRPPATAAGQRHAGPSRMFTELRLQTDFRHIAAAGGTRASTGACAFVNTPTTTPASRRAEPHPVGLQRAERVRHPRAVARPQRQAQRRVPRPAVHSGSRRREDRRPARRLRELRQADVHRLRRPVSAARVALDRRRTTSRSRRRAALDPAGKFVATAASAARIAR